MNLLPRDRRAAGGRWRGVAADLAAHVALFGLILVSAFVAMRLIALPPTHLTAIWLPSGIALIALLRRPGWWALPTIWLANWTVMAAVDHYPYFHFRIYGFAFCAVSTLGPALGAWLWRRWLKTSPFEDPWSFLRFTFGVALLPALCTGWLHIAIIFAPGGHFRIGFTWRDFLLRTGTITASDALGVFLIVPLALAPWNDGLARTTGERVLAHGVNLALAVVVAFLSYRVSALAIYLAIPLALVAAIICGGRGVNVLVLTISVCGILATGHGLGPFASPGYPSYLPLFKMTVFAFCLGLPGEFAGLTLYQLRRHHRLLETAVEARTCELERAKDAAEAADRAKSQFLATMSHEIRTPMNGVLGFARLLEADPLTPDQKECVEAILTSGETLLTLLNDILDISKIEAGAVELEAASLDVREVVQHVLRLFSAAADRKGLKLSGSVDDSVPAALSGDSIRIRQVLSNLVGNAIKFTERGSVTVRVAAGPDGAERCRLTATVVDTGIGIAPEQMARLFRPFSQGDSSITRRFGGSGLGLVISRRLCELMGGALEVESQVGRGSVFRASCVAKAVPEAAVASDPARPLGGSVLWPGMNRRLAVLVADDNYLNRRLTGALLARLGHQAEFVGNGRAAVESVRDGKFDLILMDVQMPEMDGLTATRRIRAAEAADGRPRVPVIAVTADASAARREECLRAGMDDCLVKPLDLDTFQEHLRRLAAGGSRGGR